MATTRSENRTATRSLPKGWTIIGLAGLSWAGLIVIAQGASALFQYISASL